LADGFGTQKLLSVLAFTPADIVEAYNSAMPAAKADPALHNRGSDQMLWQYPANNIRIIGAGSFVARDGSFS
jgi:hypothetical protein